MSTAERMGRIEAHLILTDRDARIGPQKSVRLGRGAALPAELWRALQPEDRHLARVLATHRRASCPPVFSGVSAAVLHGWPLYESGDPPVLVTTRTEGTNRNTAGVVRRRAHLEPHEVVEVNGLLCTSPDRTLLDLARFDRPETAVSCADAYLRDRFRIRRDIDESGLDEWRAIMQERLARLRGRRGVRRAREPLEVADPRTDSPLESVSHLYLSRFGFEVALQVPVRSPRGGNYLIDFEFLGLGCFGECDGKQKYLDVEVRGEMTADEVLYRERRRQNWVEATTRKAVFRWGWPEIATELVFASVLDAFGLPIPRPPAGLRPSARRPS
ncbi:hypothetical protein [Leucobacter ruminantium]|uniref:Transcriptional regulator, AbiEi antitoxin, Type IV TA system n=1 Tax=Leucobacter ruminantium TaxID=1289170 RepID=A0A939RY93_9MICO|nr:hypothetical protein [Leucobacter ruminantium]MBO1804219.1 hypothetical protein [Leucobacter ruminantium]